MERLFDQSEMFGKNWFTLFMKEAIHFQFFYLSFQNMRKFPVFYKNEQNGSVAKGYNSF